MYHKISKEINRTFLKLETFIKKKLYLKSKSNSILLFDNYLNNDVLYIFTIAFNNVKVIEYQIKLLKKNLNGNYVFTIVDNSNDNNSSLKIKELCQNYKISYIKCPNYSIKDPSTSHGLALNWVYKNIVVNNHIKKFGFLDHDLFPIGKIDLNNILTNSTNGVHGLVVRRNIAWYLWAGYCFFDLNILSVKKLDFVPCKIIEATGSKLYLDTGGSNWNIVYKFINYKSIFCNYDRKNYLEEIVASNTYEEDCYDLIDKCWLHSVNASNWHGNNSDKEKKKNEVLFNMLDEFMSV